MRRERQGGPSPRSILVVDDNDDNRLVLSMMLRESGYDVETAYDALTALETARRRDFDLVLMDLAMPGCDGCTAAMWIRELGGHYRDAPILAVSATVSADVADRCLTAGMQGHIPKPVTMQDLQDKVAEWLG